jgi:hypothetical protein
MNILPQIREDVNAENLHVTCVSFRACQKNTLRGFAVLILRPPGLLVKDVCLHESHGKRWVAFPARPYTDADGRQQWAAVLDFESKETWRHFQRAAVAAIDAYLHERGGGDGHGRL